MFRDQPAQTLPQSRSRQLLRERFARERMINIGGRPVIVPNPNRPQRHGDSIKMLLAFAAIYLVWGSTYLAIRYAVETIPPLVTAGIRHTVAGGILLAWACLRGYRPRREHWLAGAIGGAADRYRTHVHSGARVGQRPATDQSDQRAGPGLRRGRRRDPDRR